MGVPTIDYLPFDSDIFGFKCGRLSSDENLLTSASIDFAMKVAEEEEYRHVVVKLPSYLIKAGNLLEERGFRFKVCSLKLARNLEKCEEKEKAVIVLKTTIGYPYPKGGFSSSRGKVEALPELTTIMLDSFSSGTRFHSDPIFSKAKLKEFFMLWLINSLRKDVYVYRDKEEILGFIILQEGHVDLFCVAKKHRDCGIGKKMLSEALQEGIDSCLFQNLSSVTAVTESFNYPALNCYLNAGFRITESWNVFHWSKTGGI